MTLEIGTIKKVKGLIGKTNQERLHEGNMYCMDLKKEEKEGHDWNLSLFASTNVRLRWHQNVLFKHNPSCCCMFTVLTLVKMTIGFLLTLIEETVKPPDYFHISQMIPPPHSANHVMYSRFFCLFWMPRIVRLACRAVGDQWMYHLSGEWSQKWWAFRYFRFKADIHQGSSWWSMICSWSASMRSQGDIMALLKRIWHFCYALTWGLTPRVNTIKVRKCLK